MNKKILVTGATGTIGREVIKLLSQKPNYQVFAFVRKGHRSQKILRKISAKTQIIQGDLSISADILQINEPFDVVIHLAAIIPPKDTINQDLTYKVNLQGTQNLLNRVYKLNPALFFMYSSSIAIYGDRLFNPEIKVGDEPHILAHEVYAKTKLAAEQSIINSSADWTIFRLTAIMGGANHQMSHLMFHMPLDTSMEIATPQDCARAFVYGLEKKRALNHRIFNLGGGPKARLTYKSLLSASFEIYGLGQFDFPAKAFAEKNFHCGHYVDGDELEEIVHFRGNGISDYYSMLERKISPLQKRITRIFRGPIKFFILLRSEPLKAFKKNDKVAMEKFFRMG